MLRLALYQPDIPQNAGTMLRMCACLGVAADIIEPRASPCRTVTSAARAWIISTKWRSVAMSPG